MALLVLVNLWECFLEGLCEPSDTHLSVRDSHKVTGCHREVLSCFTSFLALDGILAFLFITSFNEVFDNRPCGQ